MWWKHCLLIEIEPKYFCQFSIPKFFFIFKYINQSKNYIYNYIIILAYFPGVARVFIYPNLILICVPSLAEIAHLDGIFSIITSTLLGGTLPTRRLIYILLHLRTNYSVAASSLSHYILSSYSLSGDCFITVTRVRYVFIYLALGST
jgi:hypothetical protein